MTSLSFWARHPPTTILMSGRVSLIAFMCPRFPYSFWSAFSRMQHVLNSTTDASSGCSTLGVALGLEHARHPFGIVLVHLAPEGADEVGGSRNAHRKNPSTGPPADGPVLRYLARAEERSSRITMILI